MSKEDKETDNIEFEINFYQELLKKRPDFIEALSAVGDLYTKKGFFHKGLEIDERLAKLKPNDPTVLYNLACSYSLVNDVDSSFRSIKKAISNGYNDFVHLENDQDLDNLRKSARFTKYYSRLMGRQDEEEVKADG